MKEKANKRGFGGGVYLLKKENIIIYVGFSNCVLNRVAQHAEKDFDSILIIKCSSKARGLKLEKELIAQYRPALNVQQQQFQAVKDLLETLKVGHTLQNSVDVNMGTAMQRAAKEIIPPITLSILRMPVFEGQFYVTRVA